MLHSCIDEMLFMSFLMVLSFVAVVVAVKAWSSHRCRCRFLDRWDCCSVLLLLPPL